METVWVSSAEVLRFSADFCHRPRRRSGNPFVVNKKPGEWHFKRHFQSKLNISYDPQSPLSVASLSSRLQVQLFNMYVDQRSWTLKARSVWEFDMLKSKTADSKISIKSLWTNQGCNYQSTSDFQLSIFRFSAHSYSVSLSVHKPQHILFKGALCNNLQ